MMGLAPTHAPITSVVGYVQGRFDDVTAEVERWLLEVGQFGALTPVEGPLPTLLHALEPLIRQSHNRLLLVPVGDWVALFDNGALGGDPPARYLANRMRTHGMISVNIPHTYSAANPHGSQGSVQWQYFGPEGTPPLQYIRSVGVTFEGRWTFDVSGTPQPFEDLDRYRARLVRDRFTPELLLGCCRAVGVDAFNIDAYAEHGQLVTRTLGIAPGAQVMTLAEARLLGGYE